MMFSQFANVIRESCFLSVQEFAPSGNLSFSQAGAATSSKSRQEKIATVLLFISGSTDNDKNKQSSPDAELSTEKRLLTAKVGCVHGTLMTLDALVHIAHRANPRQNTIDI
jgi:hypothetical protein